MRSKIFVYISETRVPCNTSNFIYNMKFEVLHGDIINDEVRAAGAISVARNL